MSWAQIAIGLAGTAIEVVLLIGLFARGHHRREPLFAFYVAATLFTNTAVGIWHRWDVWLIHQAVSAAARFGVALGLAHGVFRHFPAAAQAARRMIFFVLAVTLTGALSVTGGDTNYTDVAAVLIPRIANGTVWLFTALAALVLWYRLPLSALQKAILLGFAPYLLVFTVTMNLLSGVGWHVRDHVGYADTLAYLALLTYWCVAAWRPVKVEQAMGAPVPSSVVGMNVGGGI